MKQIFKTSVNGQIIEDRLRQTYHDQIEDKQKPSSRVPTINERVLMLVESATRQTQRRTS